MGWLKQILLGDLGQSFDIQQNAAEVEAQRVVLERQSSRIDRRQEELAALRLRIERLNLAVTALSRFLVSKGVVDPAELDAFIRQVDAEDGRIDGKLACEPRAARPRLPVHDPSWDQPGA